MQNKFNFKKFFNISIIFFWIGLIIFFSLINVDFSLLVGWVIGYIFGLSISYFNFWIVNKKFENSKKSTILIYLGFFRFLIIIIIWIALLIGIIFFNAWFLKSSLFKSKIALSPINIFTLLGSYFIFNLSYLIYYFHQKERFKNATIL